MTLKIIEFMRMHENWKELLSQPPYSLKIHTDGKFVILSYNMIESDFSEPICSEARGIIIDTTNYKIVRLAFTKFFNIDEPYAAKIDWATAKATEKIDGSIMSVWHYEGVWHVSTNGTINAENAMISNNSKSFRQLFDEAAENCGLVIEELDPKYCYTFEIVSPEQKIVIDYPETTLYHLSTRNMETLEEESMDIGIQKPKTYALTSEANIRKIVSELDATHEGVVVCDAFGNRVKIKTATYFEMHRLAGTIKLANAINLVRMNDYAEFVSYFPEYNDFFDMVKYTIEKIEEDAITLDNVAESLRVLYTNHFYLPSKRNVPEEETIRYQIVRKRLMEALSKTSHFSTYMAACYHTHKLAIDSCSTTEAYIRMTREYWIKLAEYFPEVISVEAVESI